MKSNFKRKVLSNGMTVILEKRSLPIVSVAFAVRSGGINEVSEEKGISHFIEHMLYKGTKKRSAQQVVGEIEGKGGDLNAFTGAAITGHYCKMPSKHVGVALDVLSDIIKHSLFNKKELDKERKVIFEEIKMHRDLPMNYVFHEIEKTLYEKPFSIGTLGTCESLISIDRKKILEKFKKVYTPNNLILCVVGNADFNKVVKFAEENFGNAKGKVPEFKIKLKNEEKIEERKGIDQANLIFAYHVPLAGDKKSYAAQVLSCLMAENMSSRLWQEIREKRNLAYAIKGGAEISKDFAYNFIYVGTMKENVEKVKKLILNEFGKVAKSLGESELKKIKEQMIGNYHISMEDSQSQMMNLLLHEIEGNAEKFYEFEKNISEVRLKDVKGLAGAVTKKFSFFALVPSENK